MIGSLSHLVREAALDAVMTGAERITRNSMDTIDLDQTAHEHDTTRKPRRGTGQSTKTA